MMKGRHAIVFTQKKASQGPRCTLLLSPAIAFSSRAQRSTAAAAQRSTAQHSMAQHSNASLLTSRTRILLASSDASRMSANSAGERVVATSLGAAELDEGQEENHTTCVVPTNPLRSRPALASGSLNVAKGRAPCNCASQHVHAHLHPLGRCLAASAAPAARAPGGHCRAGWGMCTGCPQLGCWMQRQVRHSTQRGMNGPHLDVPHVVGWWNRHATSYTFLDALLISSAYKHPLLYPSPLNQGVGRLGQQQAAQQQHAGGHASQAQRQAPALRQGRTPPSLKMVSSLYMCRLCAW